MSVLVLMDVIFGLLLIVQGIPLPLRSVRPNSIDGFRACAFASEAESACEAHSMTGTLTKT